VYNIMAAFPGSSFSKVTCSCAEPPGSFSKRRYAGFTSNSVASTSEALFANFAEETRSEASDWFRMYWSSAAGKAGERGMAIARAANAARRVTRGVESLAC